MPIFTKPIEHIFTNKDTSMYWTIIPGEVDTTATATANKFHFPRHHHHYHHSLAAHNGTARDIYNQSINEDVILVDEDDDDFDDEDGDQRPICGECGRELGPGWQCEHCRRNCPHCNRALTLDPDDFCERCFRRCPVHNHIFSVILNAGCPLCVERIIREKK